ncbi:MAG: type II secretion system protein [Acidobacteriota bacterium]
MLDFRFQGSDLRLDALPLFGGWIRGCRPSPTALRARSSRPWWRGVAGVSLIELVVTLAILGVLATSIMPVAKVAIQREKEIELRRDLRELRTAIDEYKKMTDAGRIAPKFDAHGYPPDLKALVEGVEEVGKISGKIKFLRRIPVDPMTNTTDWGLRSYQDDADSTSWGGQNVFDVYTKSTAKALDGTRYNSW